MSQLLIVQGQNPRHVAELFSRAVSIYDAKASLKPCAELHQPGLSVAKFPHIYSEATPLITDASGTWLCEVGTAFYRGRRGEDVQRELCAALATNRRSAPALINDVDGTFVLTWGDIGESDFYLATDRIGSLHIYTAYTEGSLVTSTSAMVIAALLRPAWDIVGLREFLATGTVFSPEHTLYRGIEKLPGATVFHFSNGKLDRRKLYWDVGSVMYDRVTVPTDVAALAEALKTSLATIRAGFRRPALDLTGGFDSRNLVAAMLHISPDFETVVVGNPEDTDVKLARRIAVECGLKIVHYPAEIDVPSWWKLAKESLPLCDGEYDILQYAKILAVHKSMAAKYDVSINGSYGELCRGLFWEILTPLTGVVTHFNERRLARNRFASDSQIPNLLAPDLERDMVEHFSAMIRAANEPFKQRPNTVQIDNNTVAIYAPRWQGRIASATNRLWPALSPFLWREPIEAALGAAVSTRVRGRMGRRLIEYLNPRLAALPTSHGYPALPLRISTAHRFLTVPPRLLYAKVRGRLATRFPGCGAPQHNSIKELLSEPEVKELLVPGQMLTRDFYRLDGLTEFLAVANGPSFRHAVHIGRILTLELLAREIQN